MRALLPLVLCLSMAVYVTADDLVLGKRQEGDSLFLSKKIKKPSLANDVTIATLNIRAPEGEVVTYVKVTNVGDSNVKVHIDNDVGKRFILGVAVGPRGEEIDLEVEAYSKRTTHAAPKN